MITAAAKTVATITLPTALAEWASIRPLAAAVWAALALIAALVAREIRAEDNPRVTVRYRSNR